MKLDTEEQLFCSTIGDIALGPIEARHNTMQLCKEILSRDDSPEGDFVEAGVFAGAHPIIMSYMLKKYGDTGRQVHMIDSFQGIPNVLEYEHDTDKSAYGLRGDGPIRSSGISGCDVAGIKGYVNQFGGWPDAIRYHEGWFQDTLPSIDINKIAILRIDVDLVESVNLCLQYLYPKIVKGGYFICDDYFSPTCKVIIDKFIKKNGINPLGVIGPEESIIYWKI